MYTSSIQGINQNIEMFTRYARDLQNIETAHVPEDMVGMMIAETGVGVNAAALKSALDMNKHVIDILA